MWVRLDDHYYDNPKILSVSIQARWIHTAAIAWCAQHLTDGVLPRRQAWKFGAEDESSRPGDWIEELVRANLFEPAGPDAYRLHDYLEFNPSRAQVLKQRAEQERRRQEFLERQKAAGEARAASSQGRDGGRFTSRTTSQATSRNGHPAGETAGDLAGETTSRTTSVNDPVPVLKRRQLKAALTAHPAVDSVDNSPPRSRSPEQDSSPRASAREESKPGGHPTPRDGPALTDEEGGRLDGLRSRILASRELGGHIESIDRVIVAHLRRGAPCSALEQGLASVLEHRPKSPADYLAKVLRVEVPNHHEAAAIARHVALKEAEARARSAPTAVVAQAEMEQVGGPVAAVLAKIGNVRLE